MIRRPPLVAYLTANLSGTHGNLDSDVMTPSSIRNGGAHIHGTNLRSVPPNYLVYSITGRLGFGESEHELIGYHLSKKTAEPHTAPRNVERAAIGRRTAFCWSELRQTNKPVARPPAFFFGLRQSHEQRSVAGPLLDNCNIEGTELCDRPN
jgi:hypothetical protein